MDRLRVAVAVAVLLAWLVALLIAAYDGRLPLVLTTPVLTSVVGWLFTEKVAAT